MRLNLKQSKEVQTMKSTDAAQKYHERMFPGHTFKFQDTDPEFSAFSGIR